MGSKKLLKVAESLHNLDRALSEYKPSSDSSNNLLKIGNFKS